MLGWHAQHLRTRELEASPGVRRGQNLRTIASFLPIATSTCPERGCAMPEHSRSAMTPQDITRIRFVSDPQLSPDGRRVAFVVTMLSEDQDEYLSNIWVVDTTGGEPRRFTTGPKRDTAPRWSPDGSRLAFVSERVPKQKAQLYVRPANGGEPMRLTDLRNGVAHPVVSPDSTRLAFVSRVGGWQEPEDEAERQKSKPARVITALKYKYNSAGFIYDRHSHIFVVSADG